MRKKFWKRTATAALATMMVFSTVGCGNTDKTEESGTESTTKTENTSAADTSAADTSAAATEKSGLEKDKTGIWNSDMGDTKWDGEEATLTLHTQYSGSLAADVSWWYDIVKEYTGVSFERTDASTETINTMLASGTFTDIVGFSRDETLASTAASGLLLNLDEYQDRLPNLYNNTILESAIQFYRDYRSGGTGKLYHGPCQIGTNSSVCSAPMIRYDIYKSIGAPEMETLEDFIEVLKQMRDAHPTTDDGNPVYVFCGWSDWGTGLWDYLMNIMGYQNLGGTATVWVERDGENISTQLEKGSVLYRTLKVSNDLWRNGYIDPDTTTQPYQTAKPKTDNGQGLFMGVEWMGGKYNDLHEGTGFAMVNADEFDIGISAPNAVGAGSIAIAASVAEDETKLDAALRFLNWFYSPSYFNLNKNGPEGYLWEYDEEGNQVFTKDGIQKYRNDRVGIPGSTGEGQMFAAQSVIGIQAYTPYTINPTTGQPLYHEYWEEFLKTDTRWDEWRADNDVITTYDWAVSQGDITVQSTAFSMMGAMPDALQMLNDTLTTTWRTYAWEMFVADSEAEFDEIWDKAVEDMETLDIQSVVDWCSTTFENAKAMADEYPLKAQ